MYYFLFYSKQIELKDENFCSSLSYPHSNGYFDINGDCIPGAIKIHRLFTFFADIILTCVASKPFTIEDGTEVNKGDNYLEVWTSDFSRQPYAWAVDKRFKLPFPFSELSLLSFHDISRQKILIALIAMT